MLKATLKKLYYKNLKHISTNTFSSNYSVCNSKSGLSKLPDIQWIILQSTENYNNFYVDLVFKYKEKFEKDMYIGLSNPSIYYRYHGYASISEYACPIFTDRNPYKSQINFYKNVVPNDEYKYDDFVNLIQLVTEKINTVLYLNEDEENIMIGKKQLRDKPLSEDELREIISEVHRDYMDKKNSKTKYINNGVSVIELTEENVREYVSGLYNNPLGGDEELIDMIKAQFPKVFNLKNHK